MSTLRSSERNPAPRPMLGRGGERRALDDLLAAVREGLSGALVLVGEAGIGKTRLLEYAADAATADGLRVARVGGMEAESQLGFAALHRLLRPFLNRLDRLPGPQRDVLSSAFGLVAGPPADRFLSGLAVLTLLSEAAADTPLVCFVDDAQWLDRESAEVLAFVGRRLHADSIGLVFAARGDQSDLADVPAFPTLDGLPALRLTGLSEPDARLLLASTATGRLAPEAFTRVVAETEGNPLALIELADEPTGAVLPSAPLPIGPRMEAHFQRRVRALPEETQSLLLVVSVAPSDDPAALWRAASALGLSANALDHAVADGILSTQRHPVFRHPLIRSAVHAGADPSRRREVHLALAAATDRRAAPDRRAWHLSEAAGGLDEEVAAELELASERARDRGGYAAQALFLARAAELTPDPGTRAGRLLAAAQAHLVLGDGALARQALDQAAPELGTPTTHAAAQRLFAAIAWLDGQIALAPGILLAEIPAVVPFDERLARDMAFEALVAALMTRENTVGLTLDELTRASLALPWDRTVPGSVADKIAYAYNTRIAEGYASAVPLLRAALDALIGEELVETGMPIALISYIAGEELWDDRGFKAVVDRLTAVSREQGALYALYVVLHSQAIFASWSGRFDLMEAYFEEADELARAMAMAGQGQAHRVELLAWQGREPQARAAAAELVDLWGRQLGYAAMANHANYALTILELSLGNYAEALVHARHGFEHDTIGQGNLLLPDVVEAAIRGGDAELAEAALARLSERALLSGTPWALGVLARSRALLADDEHAEVLYEEAIKQLGHTLVVTDLARAHLLYGEWLRRRKRRTDARVQLRKASAMFTTMGAAAFAARAGADLPAAGGQDRERAVRADHDLTPQEKQVAALAADGSTNAEIAARLFVTSSTVEYHLNKVFRKLGITSRRQLAAALRE